MQSPLKRSSTVGITLKFNCKSLIMVLHCIEPFTDCVIVISAMYRMSHRSFHTHLMPTPLPGILFKILLPLTCHYPAQNLDCKHIWATGLLILTGGQLSPQLWRPRKTRKRHCRQLLAFTRLLLLTLVSNSESLQGQQTLWL